MPRTYSVGSNGRQGSSGLPNTGTRCYSYTMALDGSPKKFACDVANGLQNINQHTLKRYGASDIKQILSGLTTVQKEIRNQSVEAGDFQALKDKGMKLQRVNGAMRVIWSYAREKKIPV